MGQESRCGLAEKLSWASGSGSLTGCYLGVSQVCGLISRLCWGNVFFQTHMALARDISSLPHRCFCRKLTTWQLAALRGRVGERERERGERDTHRETDRDWEWKPESFPNPNLANLSVSLLSQYSVHYKGVTMSYLCSRGQGEEITQAVHTRRKKSLETVSEVAYHRHRKWWKSPFWCWTLS